jgi:hypothetical protein
MRSTCQVPLRYKGSRGQEACLAAALVLHPPARDDQVLQPEQQVLVVPQEEGHQAGRDALKVLLPDVPGGRAARRGAGSAHLYQGQGKVVMLHAWFAVVEGCWRLTLWCMQCCMHMSQKGRGSK